MLLLFGRKLEMPIPRGIMANSKEKSTFWRWKYLLIPWLGMQTLPAVPGTQNQAALGSSGWRSQGILNIKHWWAASAPLVPSISEAKTSISAHKGDTNPWGRAELQHWFRKWKFGGAWTKKKKKKIKPLMQMKFAFQCNSSLNPIWKWSAPPLLGCSWCANIHPKKLFQESLACSELGSMSRGCCAPTPETWKKVQGNKNRSLK